MLTIADDTFYRGTAELLDVMPERVIRYRLSDLTIVYCNVAWASGHHLTPEQVVGRTLTDLLSVAERTGLEAQLLRIGPDVPLVADDVPRPAPNAPGQWVEWVDQYLPGVDGAEILTVGRDVTGRHTAELNLANSEARFRDLADNSTDVVWRFVSNPSPHFDYMSPSVESILGYPPSLFLDDFTRFLDILDDDSRALITRSLLGTVLPQRQDLRFRRVDGAIVIGEMQTTRIHGGLQGVSRDVTELRRLQDDLAKLALRDPLTGLANRRLLTDLLEDGLARTRRTGSPLAVAFLDLDDLKAVNDTFGHDAGDAVLCETARRLLAVVRTSVVVARLGGDEFVVVYEPSEPDDDNLIERIETALAVPVELSPTGTVRCPASIGLADTRVVGYDASALLASADAAMYAAKRQRKSRAVAV